MEQFHDGHHVWLRSRAHGTYLCADDDGSGVSLQLGRASVHAAWAVHILHLDGTDFLMLHSAANGRYLAATDNVTLCDLNLALPSFIVVWLAVRSGYGDDVLLSHTDELFLRAPFRRDPIGVRVDVFDERTTIMQWAVEAIPRRDFIPRLPNPSPSTFSGLYLITYVRANPYGMTCPTDRRSFLFFGRSVLHLRARLARRLGIRVASNAILCVRAGSAGRLTPLVTDLPLNNVVLDIIVITAHTSAADRLRHPNVDAA